MLCILATSDRFREQRDGKSMHLAVGFPVSPPSIDKGYSVRQEDVEMDGEQEIHETMAGNVSPDADKPIFGRALTETDENKS